MVGVVASDNEDGVFVPGHFARGGKEVLQGVVDVADAGVHGVAFLMEALAVVVGHNEGVVRGGSEESGAERLLHLVHGVGVELQKLFIPYRPCAVEIGIASETRVGIIFSTPEVMGKARTTGKCLKAHRAVFGTVEEGGSVAYLAQFASDTTDVVERVACEDEGFDKHGYAAEDRGHGVDALASVGVRLAEGEALTDE